MPGLLALLFAAFGVNAAPQLARYGAWRSPITSEAIVAESIKLGQVGIDGDSIWWIEGRPQEQGRNVLVRRAADGATDDVTPPGMSVRTRAHEYGGGAFVLAAQALWFSNDGDQALYRQTAEGLPFLQLKEPGARYADAAFDAPRQRLILIREWQREAGQEPESTLIAVGLEGAHRVQVLARGADFYSSPRLSPDGRQLAWLSWSHPNMPWDGTSLNVARIADDGSLAEVQTVAGAADESVFQPEWSPSGELVYASDRSGWWNLYGWRDGTTRALHAMRAEFGEPQWEFAMSRYGFLRDGRILTSYIEDGDAKLALLDPANGKFTPIPTAFREIKELHVGDGFAVFLGGSAALARSVVRLDLKTLKTEVLRSGSGLAVDAGDLSVAKSIEFPTVGNRKAHAFYYAPRNRAFSAPKGEKPPLLVLSHGGPTSQATATFNPNIQFWTSRGFAVVDVNYGGSSGYGRAYRRRLNGQWGIVDVDDCVAAAEHLVAQGLADPARLAIRGGSAGGYTTLAALAFRSVFRAGASYYGVGDLETLARDTHKFESRYLDSLVGPYPERKDLYVERSPVHAVDRISSALILFQGLDDKVVPPNQAQAMYAAVKAKGLPVAYLPFEGEQHGFRRAATLRRALEAELYFYGHVFGFAPADVIEPVAIDNLPQ